MGKPTASPAPGASGSSSNADAVSLHTQPGLARGTGLEDDVPELPSDDPPPLYSDIEPASASHAPLLTTVPVSSGVLDVLDNGLHREDTATGSEFFLYPLLDRDPDVLEQQIRHLAVKPPRPSVRILGTHTRTVHENGKTKTKTVTDFDVSVDLTPYLFSDASTGASWSELRTVENSEKVRRGTVFRQRAPGVTRDLEVGTSTKPTLAEWCHRYCASHAGIKCFAIRRRVVGFDEGQMRTLLEALVRGTNYRGSLTITFPVKGEHVYVYNDCWINRWRVTPWIVWLFYLTFLWLLTWPYLFFSTKVFEVAVVEWPFSATDAHGRKRYVSMSESHLYNLWGRAITRAVLNRRQGTLTQEDLIDSQTAPSEPFSDVLQGSPGFIREGVNAITAFNRQFGWGGDS